MQYAVETRAVYCYKGLILPYVNKEYYIFSFYNSQRNEVFYGNFL